MSFAYILETCLQPVQPIYSIVPAVPTATQAVAGAGLTSVVRVQYGLAQITDEPYWYSTWTRVFTTRYCTILHIF